jgi:hypothetical protein
VVLTVWSSATLIGWLAELGIGPGGAVNVDMVVVAGPGFGMPTMPDRVALVIPSAGPGLFLEGVGDRPEFTLLIRGPQGDPLAAEQMSFLADRLILATVTPAPLPDGTYLLKVDRDGGRPAPAEQGRDGDRATYSARYLTEISE